MNLLEKCYDFEDAKHARSMGLYPYFKVVESEQGAEAVVDGKKMIMVGSNNYLGLTNHPKVKEAVVKAVKQYGTGCTGSRYLNGTLAIHVEAEERLAQFMQREAALMFSTGYQTNLGTIASLVGKGEYVITDRLDHASILDGCRLSFGKTLKFRHNDMADLERILSRLDPAVGRMVVVDGGLQHGGQHRQPAGGRQAVPVIRRRAGGGRRPFHRHPGRQRARHRRALRHRAERRHQRRHVQQVVRLHGRLHRRRL